MTALSLLCESTQRGVEEVGNTLKCAYYCQTQNLLARRSCLSAFIETKSEPSSVRLALEWKWNGRALQRDPNLPFIFHTFIPSSAREAGEQSVSHSLYHPPWSLIIYSYHHIVNSKWLLLLLLLS